FFLSGPQHWDADQKKSVCNDGANCIMTYELAVVHSTFIVRYGEVGLRHPQEVVPGANVSEGQLIAWVGAQSVHTMLHFEMYSDPTNIEPLTQKDNKKYLNITVGKGKSYMRRKDLMDPTFYLNNCFLKGVPRPNPGPF